MEKKKRTVISEHISHITYHVYQSGSNQVKIHARRLGLFFRTRYILSFLLSFTLSSVWELEVWVTRRPWRIRLVCANSSSWRSSGMYSLMMR